MEQKTIGKFITTLRKANGMTQKELAEKLNVSDKTVSRWERDDGAPDLATIPVIAEIFGVTCDELLRGERKSPAERTEEPAEEPTAKGEKQRKRILDMTLSGYRNQTYITMGISTVGLIAAMICNLGFLRAYIGFFAGAIFFVASLVMQAICTNQAFHAVSDDTIPTEESGKGRAVIWLTAKRAVCVTAVLFASTLPLIIFPIDTYMGIQAGSWLTSGLGFSAIAFVLCQMVWHFVYPQLLKKNQILMDEKEQTRFWHNHKIKRTCALILAIIVGITALGHIAFNEIWSPGRIAEGETFTDYDSFRKYMLLDIEYNPSGSVGSEPITPIPGEDEVIRKEIWVYHDNLEEGEMVCRYVQNNMSVRTVRTSDTSDGLPVTAITYASYHAAERKIALINAGFVALYLADSLLVLMFYRKKRMKVSVKSSSILQAGVRFYAYLAICCWI